MITSLMDRFLERLRQAYPEYPISVQRYSSPDDPTIEYFIDILLVPDEKLHDTNWDAWGLAEEVYGEQSMPFLMSAVNPETSAEHAADDLSRGR